MSATGNAKAAKAAKPGYVQMSTTSNEQRFALRALRALRSM